MMPILPSWGPDTLTIQGASLARYCVANETIRRQCDVYIGIQGFYNASYSIMVSTNDGFSRPLSLLEGIPQSGFVEEHMYQYYKFQIAPFDASLDQMTSSISFTLTSEVASDLDMYVSFSKEPGMDSYDYKLEVNYF